MKAAPRRHHRVPWEDQELDLALNRRRRAIIRRSGGVVRFLSAAPFLMFFKSTPGRRGNLIIPSPPLAAKRLTPHRMRLENDRTRWASFARRNSSFLKRKTHFGVALRPAIVSPPPHGGLISGQLCSTGRARAPFLPVLCGNG